MPRRGLVSVQHLVVGLELRRPHDRKLSSGSRHLSGEAIARAEQRTSWPTSVNALRISFKEGGASGFIADRYVWRRSLGLGGQACQKFLDTVAKSRLEKLVRVATERARPWTIVAQTVPS